ncbi:hypothetical protein OC844_001147 [Tilletia horrida]|nr:hypothetical protein OC844_001147 [Tilletia horrida]
MPFLKSLFGASKATPPTNPDPVATDTSVPEPTDSKSDSPVTTEDHPKDGNGPSSCVVM